ncbi:serine/threonine-protein kinase [Moorena producens JHB]|uniref:non-specific serine/threonine protein kinase n=1 Tax=Moorena producens (strain JHB) TaxID=1454205 RepID=A0A1D9G4I1_MOOP1|nr:serine/threonine-protein kinase [Moorena producens]AOY82434.1 serine/threonine-protein kinase [Moorena producens JHB]
MIQIGQEIHNRYQVIKKLGSGNFSQTFEVEDLLGINSSNLGKRKVLKVLNLSYYRTSKTREKVVELFQREVEVLKQLNHPGIPRVEPDSYFRFVPNKNNQEEFLHCLVMEKIDGITLEEWLLQNNQLITEAQAIDWLKQLIVILNEIHPKYLHRDIKPDNIMLRPNGQLVLIDFGAVKALTQQYIIQQQSTSQNTSIGTLGYMPPEMMNEQEAYPQSDFFSLGRTFVRLLSGKHPSDFTQELQNQKLFWRNDVKSFSKRLLDLIDFIMEPDWQNRPKNTQEILLYMFDFLMVPAANNHYKNTNAVGIRRVKHSNYNFINSGLLIFSIVLNFFLIGLLNKVDYLMPVVVLLLFVVVSILFISLVFPLVFPLFIKRVYKLLLSRKL